MVLSGWIRFIGDEINNQKVHDFDSVPFLWANTLKIKSKELH